MNWRTKLKILSTLGLCYLLLACGVKGDPLPPEKPTEMGRGRPTYRRATEGIKIEKRRQAPGSDEEEEEQDGENEGANE